jgi:dihydroflavonol-4-reductase
MSLRVCVTGASGFLGSHVVQGLLRAGSAVIAIGRCEGACRKFSEAAGAAFCERVVDLASTDALDGAFDECDAVIHCAASVTNNARRGSKAWIDTLSANLQGTEAVLRGVRQASKVRTLVFTSSLAAVLSPGRPAGYRFSESDWNDEPLKSSDPYWFSKTAAERLLTTAFAQTLRSDCRLVCINPSMIIGPAEEARHVKSSVAILGDLHTGKIPACPDLSFYFVDVRDVAGMHVQAVLDDTVAGRFLVPGTEASMVQLAETIRRHFPDSRAPHRRAPDWLMYLTALLTGRVSVRYLRQNLGAHYLFDDSRARSAFNLRYRPLDQTIIDTIRSLQGGAG